MRLRMSGEAPDGKRLRMGDINSIVDHNIEYEYMY
jgi:hypothetical protein